MKHRAADFIGLTAVFLFSRAACWARGLRMNFDLAWTVLADPKYLREELLHTVWLFHAVPPGWNLLTGVLLKLAPRHPEVLAQVLFLCCGLVLVSSLFWLACEARLPRWLAVLSSLGFSLTPPVLYFENLYHYEYVVTTLLVVAAVLFRRATTRGTTPRWLSFFCVCASLVWLRSVTGLPWFVLTLAITLAVTRAGRTRVLLGALGPLLVVLTLYAKNYALFGVFDSSTQGPANFTLITTYQLPDELRRRWVEEGKLSPFSKSAYASPQEFLPYFPDASRWSDPVLTDLDKLSVSGSNYNHWVYLEVNARRRHDVFVYLREFPGEYLRTVFTRGLPTTFSPTTRWHPRTGTATSPHFAHHEVLGRWEHAWNRVVHECCFAPVGLYALLPLVLAWVSYRAWRALRSQDEETRGLGAWWCFVLTQVLLVTSLVSAAALGENARYRFIVEPFIWLAAASALSDLISRTRAPRRASASSGSCPRPHPFAIGRTTLTLHELAGSKRE